MPSQEAPLDKLKAFIPEKSFGDTVLYVQKYNVHLTVTKGRQSILGDYRHAYRNKPHRISVNGNLNKYAFLITLLHELAHLFTYEKFGNKVQSHGKEWKMEYGRILKKFLVKKIFPADIEKTLLSNLSNPAASSCADENLMRVLHNYDKKPKNVFLLEQLPADALFKITGDRIFIKGRKIRKRYECKEIKTGKLYLFSPVYEVASVKAC